MNSTDSATLSRKSSSEATEFRATDTGAPVTGTATSTAILRRPWRWSRRLPAIRLRHAGLAVRVVAILALWELLSRTMFAGKLILPPPDVVIRQIWADRSIYPANIGATLREALYGFVAGNLVAFIGAV